ncbi:sensor histidine kinase [Sinorhizobium medicae]|uniref:Two-component sensor histidine kinase n=1 Tax=Sinorhizobium medicae TaxID=110321 RepID=A0ABX4TET8_9HYPH|nr:histidine kinase [Sinorhizobium medicae]PLT94963.1 two-component sensor histidine kinase [Sinorhizobium medicae]PLU11601.1 two-component sensor histidine kinase [Sinorhizobium medicae]PLU75821.1 two-component sensor histidine kinase [Sinorhizobium medicae]
MASLDFNRNVWTERTPQEAHLFKRVAATAGDWLLGVNPERLIGIGRLVTASFAILAIYLDPSHPVAPLYESRLILSLYIFLSILLVAYPLGKSLDSPVHLIVHIIDAIILGWLTFLTNELTSPFFAVLPFVLLAMTMRWGLKGAAFGAFILLLVHLIVGLPDLLDGEAELDVFIMRSTYFVLAAVILGYFGAYRERSRRRLARLAEWPFDATAGDRVSWLGLLCEHASQVLGGSRLLVVWREQEEAAGCVAYYADGRLKLVDIQRADFWRRHHLQSPSGQQHKGSSPTKEEEEEELAVLIAELPELAEAADRRIRHVSCAPFSSVRYRGRVFVINPNSVRRPDEGGALTKIIASRFGAELERLALIRQTTEAARSEERMRLACDLHDSVLQNLTAARLKLKLVAEAAGSDTKIQLGEVGALIFEQQQRVRQFVEENRTADEPASVGLEQTLSSFLGLLREQWNCRMEISINPAELAVPKWMAHELKQLISEATANAVRHGQATQIRMSIGEINNGLQLEVTDNGSGMPSDTKFQKPSSLSARVAKLGGDLVVYRTAPGFGIKVALPAVLEVC